MKKKKILLLGLNGRGGPLTYSCTISSYLSKYCDVSLLLPSYSIAENMDKKVKILRVKAPYQLIPTFFLTLNIFQHIKIIRAMNKTKPEVLNILDIHPWYLIYLPFLKYKKLVVTINDPKPHTGEGNIIMLTMINIITKILLRNADEIVTLSKGQVPVIRELGYKQRVVASKLGNQHEKTEGSTKILAKSNPKNILFFGRIKEYKGLSYLLKALILLKEKKRKFKLIIAGFGDMTPYQKDLKKLGPEYVDQDIRDIYGEDITKYFQKSAFVVLPYIDATQTGIASISYSFEKPLIVSNVGSLPEVVLEGKTGHIVESKNIKQLSKAIENMLLNPTKTKLMGVEGKKFLEREYNWEKIAKDLYTEIYK